MGADSFSVGFQREEGRQCPSVPKTTPGCRQTPPLSPPLFSSRQTAQPIPAAGAGRGANPHPHHPGPITGVSCRCVLCAHPPAPRCVVPFGDPVSSWRSPSHLHVVLGGSRGSRRCPQLRRDFVTPSGCTHPPTSPAARCCGATLNSPLDAAVGQAVTQPFPPASLSVGDDSHWARAPPFPLLPPPVGNTTQGSVTLPRYGGSAVGELLPFPPQGTT